ncbi:NEQ211 [Nanoarchaeum equitans Kin4-M]|uniref:alanine--tRNA ligase n=1 Tax=Nanoarchaeum equitans (strain Kin4-M) TaxID=228908 RepID=Q74ND3_NANEQ|nr:NEQ211 [Nanoarchaeum equitans Kin4-M]
MIPINEIILEEYKKYKQTEKQFKPLIEKTREKIKNLSDEEKAKVLFELYISKGITPDLIVDHIPEKFYELLEKHRQKSKAEKHKKEIDIDVSKYKPTEFLFWKDTFLKFCEANLLGIEKDYAIFDKTVFYPTMGGQEHDTGYIIDRDSLVYLYKTGQYSKYNIPFYKDVYEYYKDYQYKKEEIVFVRVIDVIKKGKVILHKVDDIEKLKKIENPVLLIDFDRRLQLSRNHTAVHIITGIARKLFGEHIWQAGAEKKYEYATIDLTHYKNLSDEELELLEKEANKIVMEMRPIKKYFLPKNEAEKRFGFRIYQGGVVPEKILRIVEIEDLDVEACSGTHLDNTIQVGYIKILASKKISDNTIRIYLTTGNQAVKEIIKRDKILKEISKITKTDIDNTPIAVKKFFDNWKAMEKKYDSLLKDYFRLIQEKINNGEYIIKVSDSLELSDLIKLIKKLIDLDCVVLYNKNYAVGVKCKDQIEKLGFRVRESKNFFIGLIEDHK